MTKKKLPYVDERRSVVRQILDHSVCAVSLDCERLTDFLERQKTGLVDLLSDYERHSQGMIRAVIDEYGPELAQHMHAVLSLIALYKCRRVNVDRLSSRLSEIAAIKDSLLKRMQSDTEAGHIPDYELLIAPWMMLIEVQNEALVLKSALDGSLESFLELKQRLACESSEYMLVRYGQHKLEWCDRIVSVTEDELRMDTKSWQSVYDQIGVHSNHLRGMIEFAEVQYSKGIQDETALLSRIFLIGVAAQLMVLFTVSNDDRIANQWNMALLATLSIVPPWIIYYLARRLYKHLASKKRIKRSFPSEVIKHSWRSDNDVD